LSLSKSLLDRSKTLFSDYLAQNRKDTLYRIHGTNEPETIGQAVSSGCIRMLNEDVMDLYERNLNPCSGKRLLTIEPFEKLAGPK
jgi:hypothetical protein